MDVKIETIIRLTSVTYLSSQHYQLHSITISKRIELESPGWSGFKIATKSDQPELSSSIRFEVTCIQTQRIIPVMYW